MTGSSNSSNYHWFLNTLVKVNISYSAGMDNISVLQHLAPHHDSPLLHIHKKEDEVFHILDGDFFFKIGDSEYNRSAGDTIIIHQGTPHTYRIDSENGGQWLTITTHSDFEQFVIALSRPAERVELPEPARQPSAEDQKALMEMASKYGIDIVGPPLH